MFSKEELKKSTQLSTINRVLIFAPTYKNVLWIISKDKGAFAAGFSIELYKSGAVKEGNTHLSEMLKIYLELKEKGYVRNGGMEVHLTKWGWMYLISRSLWFQILVSVAAIVGAVVGIMALNSTSTEKPKSIQEYKTDKDTLPSQYQGKANKFVLDTSLPDSPHVKK